MSVRVLGPWKLFAMACAVTAQVVVACMVWAAL